MFDIQAMTKSLEVISEAVRNPKHPFRKVENQPKKPLKHRYERRKIKEYLHLGDWVSGETASNSYVKIQPAGPSFGLALL